MHDLTILTATELATIAPERLQNHLTAVYVLRIAPGRRRTMQQALRSIVQTYVDAAWAKLRYLGWVWAAMNTYQSHDIDLEELRRRIEQARAP